MKTVVLLVISNLFMTLAWYGHLKYLRGAKWPLFAVILISWGIAFFEYCFQVPANRIGYATFSATQLKIIQEVISLVVFSLFAVAVLGEKLRWNHGVSFLLLLGAVYFAFLNKSGGA
ncbi:MAG TPA: DMT family protein, partial [Kiritimatiellia bacterium]|nr:DMT family protein [Kiritimatiellia bacterium]